jgi:hypothetical protein
MATKTKSRPAPALARKTKKAAVVVKVKKAAIASDFGSMPDYWQTPVFTTEERITRIAALGKRVDGYVHFMIKINGLNGSSRENKERAVVIFYERLLELERELARIQEDVQLG